MSTSDAELLVKVRRQPGDYRLATYFIEKIYRMRRRRHSAAIGVACVWLRLLQRAGRRQAGAFMQAWAAAARDQGLHHQEA